VPLPHELRPIGKVGDIAGRKILDESVAAAFPHLVAAVEHDVLQSRHFIRPECQRTIGAHLHAGPAIVVVGRRDHRDTGHVEIELREVGHRRYGKPDIVHLAAGGEKAVHQCHLDRGGIGTEIVAGDDFGLYAKLMDQRAKPKT
jgi:hypothetical protein